MRSALNDPLSALALISALVIFAILSVLAAQPNFISDGSAPKEPPLSEAMRGESNGETGRDLDPDIERRDI
jgi:hypothetical protein